jgi:cytochrome c553
MSFRKRPAFRLAFASLAVAATSILPQFAAAQLTRVTPTAEDMKAVYANPVDIAEGRKVAASACASCHGADGVSKTKEIPHLASQRAAYLNAELRAYRAGTGARTDPTMRSVVRDLSDAALLKVAAYYASLDPPPVAAAESGKAAAARPDPVQAGKAASAPCAGCHGEAGVGKIPGMPSLAGFDTKYLVSSMKAYKTGERKHDMMAAALAKVSDAEIANLALYYALQKPVRTENPAPGDKAAGKKAAAGCAGCHGELGVSENPAIPSLAGQDATYFFASLRNYKEGSRHDEPMKGLVTALDDTTIKNMAAHYASLQPQPAKVRKPLATAEWAQRCDRCHGIDGNSADPRIPALAGQRADYLQKVLNAYRTGARQSPEMAAMSEALSEADVENLALHYSRQKPRAVVYVIVPSK